MKPTGAKIQRQNKGDKGKKIKGNKKPNKKKGKGKK
jgi:hypothetical protein